MNTFCRGGQVKAFMSLDGLPKVLDDIKLAFHQHFGTEFRGTLRNDLLALGAQGETMQNAVWTSTAKTADLETDIYEKLIDTINSRSSQKFHSYRRDSPRPSIALEPLTQSCNKIIIHGVNFTPSTRSKGNSQILFKMSQDPKTLVPGLIQSIFLHKRPGPNGDIITEHFLVVQRYQPLKNADVAFDPYRRYPLLDAHLCHDILCESVIVISLEDVVSHFASCLYESSHIEGKLRVVLSLDRVCSYLSFLPQC